VRSWFTWRAVQILFFFLSWPFSDHPLASTLKKKIACGADLLRLCEASAFIAGVHIVCQIFARKAVCTLRSWLYSLRSKVLSVSDVKTNQQLRFPVDRLHHSTLVSKKKSKKERNPTMSLKKMLGISRKIPGHFCFPRWVRFHGSNGGDLTRLSKADLSQFRRLPCRDRMQLNRCSSDTKTKISKSWARDIRRVEIFISKDPSQTCTISVYPSVLDQFCPILSSTFPTHTTCWTQPSRTVSICLSFRVSYFSVCNPPPTPHTQTRRPWYVCVCGGGGGENESGG